MMVYYPDGERLELREVKRGMEDEARELCESISRLRLQKLRPTARVIEEIVEPIEDDCLELLGSMLKPKFNWNHC